MKRIILVLLLVGIAGVAGLVRSHSKTVGAVREWPSIIHNDQSSGAEAREEIRRTFELSPGARVEIAAINGWVKIETSDTRTAEIFIERIGSCQEVLNRRKVVVDNSHDGLTVRGETGDGNFFSRIFGSKPSEHVTVRLPRQITLVAQGVNGAVTVGEIEGSVEIHGVNGRVDVAQASGSAELHGINGNVSVAFKQVGNSVGIHGINGNIELRLGDKVNADLEAEGMNGNVSSDIPNVVVDKTRHGSYSAQIGNGGNSISVSGINGDIRLTRTVTASTNSEQGKNQS